MSGLVPEWYVRARRQGVGKEALAERVRRFLGDSNQWLNQLSKNNLSLSETPDEAWVQMMIALYEAEYEALEALEEMNG